MGASEIRRLAIVRLTGAQMRHPVVKSYSLLKPSRHMSILRMALLYLSRWNVLGKRCGTPEFDDDNLASFGKERWEVDLGKSNQ
jgi:hypothetical protein